MKHFRDFLEKNKNCIDKYFFVRKSDNSIICVFRPISTIDYASFFLGNPSECMIRPAVGSDFELLERSLNSSV